MEFQILFAFGVPALVILGARKISLIQMLSPIAVCYGIGIAFGNVPAIVFEEQLALDVCGATVLLAIPLLLFGVDIIAWLKLARTTLVSMLAGFVAVSIAATVASLAFGSLVPDAGLIAGMLSGLFTGGTVNMAAIGKAVGVAPEVFVLVNVADVSICGAYYLALLAGGYRFFDMFLPSHRNAKLDDSWGGKDLAAMEKDSLETSLSLSVADILQPLALGILVAAAAAGLMFLSPKSVQDTVAILAASTIALGLSFVPKIRAMPGAYAVGDYMLMVFAVSMGSIAKIDKLFAPGAGTYVAFFAVVLVVAMSLMVLFSYLLKIDCDTMIITSTAGLFGPAFVAPVAARLQRPELVVSGIACGLAGIALGTYLGIGLSSILAG